MLSVFAVVLSLFWVLTDEVVFERENIFDKKVHQFFSMYTSPGLTHVMTVFTFFGSRDFLLPAYLVIVAWYLFVKKDRGNSLSIAAIALAGAGVLFLLKQTFRRDRPLQPLLENVRGFSYPSGHSFSAFTFCGIVTYLVWISDVKKVFKWFWTVLLFLCATLIALSRVYLQVHYATDVIAGFGLSLLWLLICYLILKKTGQLKPVKTL